jgi:DNA polymerase elongation subunit (family B)
VEKDKIDPFQTNPFKSINSTLTIYKGKPDKKVLFLSLKHKSVTIEKNKRQTPEIITYYNNTKFDVDVLDQMAKKYTIKTSSRTEILNFF